MALRAPWYVCERGEFDRFDPRALRPALQKYDATDFVERLLRDPTDSVRFDPVEDVWGYPVPVPLADRGPGRLRFATHRMIRPGPLKLFQASHDRFYAVVVELFCPEPGLPRPGAAADDIEVGFVVRRRTVDIDADVLTIRRMARDLTGHLVAAQQQRVDGNLKHVDVDDVLVGQIADGEVTLPAEVSVKCGTEAWMIGPGGQARWRPLGVVPDGLEVTEMELPMWRLPQPEQSCEDASTRSLWFGLLPTYSSEHADALDDPDTLPTERSDKGAPKYDEHAIYQVRCLARRPGAPEGCPPRVSWSDPTVNYRLAPFFDPEGTKNHAVSITMPDFRAVAARAGRPPGPGGVTITSPPGSQMSFDPDNGSPSGGSVGGDTSRVCTFALELFMIVAFFLFSLFLPVVVLLFQLWWLLALRFCLPAPTAALNLLATHFQTKGIADLPAQPPETVPPTPRTVADRGHLDDLLGGRGLTDALTKPTSNFDTTQGKDLFGAVDPRGASPPQPVASEEPLPDPLCRVED